MIQNGIIPKWTVVTEKDCIEYSVENGVLKINTKIAQEYIGEKITVKLSAEGYPDIVKILEVI